MMSASPVGAGPISPVHVPDLLPILPLRGLVVFPLTFVPLIIGQKRSLELVQDVMNRDRLLGLLAQRRPDEVQPAPDELYAVGTIGRVHQLVRAPDGTLRLAIQGLERIRIRYYTQAEPFLLARVDEAPETGIQGLRVEALGHTARDLFQQFVSLMPSLPDELAGAVATITDSREIAYLIANMAPFETSVRQELLEIDSMVTKLERLVELLQHQISVLELEQHIASQTQEHLSRAQREFLLREQLKTIQRELGEEEGGAGEVSDLRERLERVGLPDEARREAERELSRLQKLPPGSPEEGIIRTYLDWILSLPWHKYTGGVIDIPSARKVLDEDHYDLDKIKERILEQLAVHKLRAERASASNNQPASGEERVPVMPAPAPASPLPQVPEDELRREPILCLVGPPGVGKTSLGQSIARAMSRKFVRISLGGVHDEGEIRGHRRTYIGAMPGRIIQAMRRADTSDPVFMLDEVDKLGVGFHGDPAAALLEVLDPAQNQSFVDNYLGVPFDLSKVIFLCTANTTDNVSPVLLDRLEVLWLSGYTELEKLHIARSFLVPRQLRANGLRADELQLEDDALVRTVREYTREAGVRNLERELANVARKSARRISEGASTPITVQSASLPEYLGHPRYWSELAERTDRPGVATGLAWTAAGGEVLFVETTIVPSRDERLILTGMLGDVMRESAQTALSCVRSLPARNGLDPRVFDGKAVHVHVPAGAVPKDGPSAGLTILVALASLAANRPVRGDVAMTGEITLRGKVLPVGGIREKVLAAYRAGVSSVMLPKRNEMDLEDIPLEVRNSVSIELIDSVDAALDRTLGHSQAGADRWRGNTFQQSTPGPPP